MYHYRKTFKTSIHMLVAVALAALIFIAVPMCSHVYADTHGTKYNPQAGYYGQMNTEQKKLYDELAANYLGVDGLSNGKTEDLSISVEDNSLVATTPEDLYQAPFYAYQAFVYDHPEVFWAGDVDVKVCFHKEGKQCVASKVEYRITERYPGAKAKISAYNEGVVKTSKQIADSVKTENPYDYYKAIHDWLCDNLTYNKAARKNDDRYRYAYSSGTVFAGNRKVKCQGYGESFKVLCDQIRRRNGVDGLYTTEVIGHTFENEPHMWNYVLLGTKWYGVDVLWDDQKASMSHTYFLCGAKTKGYHSTFQAEHIENNCFSVETGVKFTYPKIESKSFGEQGSEQANKRKNSISCRSTITKTANLKKSQSFPLNAHANGATLTYTASNKNVTVENGKVTIKKGYVGKTSVKINAAETEDYLPVTRTVVIEVLPSKTEIARIKRSKAETAVTVSWKQNATGHGYEVQISKTKDFKKVLKKQTVKGRKTTTAKLTGLKSGKLYVRIRTTNGKLSSKWSKVKMG